MQWKGRTVAMYMHELDIDLRIFCHWFLPHNFPRLITRNNPLNVLYWEPSTGNTDKLYTSKYQLSWANGRSYTNHLVLLKLWLNDYRWYNFNIWKMHWYVNFSVKLQYVFAICLFIFLWCSLKIKTPLFKFLSFLPG